MESDQANSGALTSLLRRVAGGGWVLGTLLVIAIAILVWCPLASRMELSGDEGYELQKARLLHRGWTLYRDIWNDQPPLHTWVLSQMFRVHGEEALWGRLLSLAAALWVSWNVGYWCRKANAGGMGGALAVGMLFSHGTFFTLSTAAMLEMPAAAVAMTAVRVAAWRRLPEWLASTVAGVVMGLAAQVKVIALLYCPAAVWVLWFHRSDALGWRMWGPRLVHLAAFVAGIVLGFLCIAALWPGQLSGLWTHFSPQMREAFAHMHAIHWDWVPGASPLAVCLALFPLAATRQQWKACLPFLVNLASTLLVLQVHRPIWWMYTLHLLVPSAVLAAVSVQAGWESFSQLFSRLAQPASMPRRIAGLVVFFLGLTTAPAGLVGHIRETRRPDSEATLELVEEMRRGRAFSEWAFSVELIAAFQAGMMTPPWTTVMPEKRIRLDPNAREAIADDLERWQPAAVYLFARLVTPRIQAILDRDYDLVFYDDTDYLYLRKGLARPLPEAK